MRSKECNTCRVEKSLEEFYKSSVYKKNPAARSAYQGHCIQCRRKVVYKYYDRIKLECPDRCKENHKKFRAKWKQLDPEKQKFMTLKENFGIRKEDWENIFNTQEGKCKICRKSQSELSKTLCVDHCHKTGQIRGLLCFSCNSALGLFDDNILSIEKAADYLKNTDDYSKLIVTTNSKQGKRLKKKELSNG